MSKHLLGEINVPVDAIICDSSTCTQHYNDIDSFYSSICEKLALCTEKCIPHVKLNSKVLVHGWNEFVKSSHQTAREAFLWWQSHNKPRHGPVYELMRKSRANFKYCLRSCKNKEEEIKYDQLASYMSELNQKDFWKQVKQMNCSNSTVPSTIDGVTGDKNIAERWKCHYESIFNSVKSNNLEASVRSVIDDHKCKSNTNDVNKVTPTEVEKIIKCLKKGKAAGPDGLTSECLIFANFNLSILLSLCFNAMFVKYYIPNNWNLL